MEPRPVFLEFHGLHREPDAVRLAIIFRNLFSSGQLQYSEDGTFNAALATCMRRVERLMRQTVEDPALE